MARAELSWPIGNMRDVTNRQKSDSIPQVSVSKNMKLQITVCTMVTISACDLDKVSSLMTQTSLADAYRVARGFQLRFDMKNEPHRLSYEGFRREVS